MGGREGMHKDFDGEPKGIRPFGRPGCRWDINRLGGH
jgi:hypothetical protein